MMAGSSLWPEAEYTMNATTDASTGMQSAIALLAERIRINERISLTGKNQPLNLGAKKNTAYDISLFLNPEILSRKGASHAKSLITFMPTNTSCKSFARLSVQIILFARSAKRRFMTKV